MKEPIIKEYDAEYASEVMYKIPYGYVNKTVCGIGLTCVALENDISTIIVVPSVYLAKNKSEQYPNNRYNGKVLAVYGKTKEHEISNYVSNNKILKIMVTYDSLPRVKYLLDRCDLVIDESNELLSKTKLKPEVIQEVFDISKEYRYKISFISATPIPLEYMPDWISDLDQVELRWKKNIKVKPILCPRPFPYKSFKEEIAHPLYHNKVSKIGEVEFKKVLVFVNSLIEIANIVKEVGIEPKDCAVICGDNIKNTYKMKDVNLKRLMDCSKLPMFTFVTSAGFSGIDIVDKDVLTIIISSVGKEYTMLDMLTDIKQASSRQRDKTNPHYGTYLFMYNQNILESNDEEFLDKLEKNNDYLNTLIDMWIERKQSKDEKKIIVFRNLISNDPLAKTYLLKRNEQNDYEDYIINEHRFNADKYFVYEIKKQYEKGFNIRGDDNDIVILDSKIDKIDVSYLKLVEYFDENNKDGIVDWGEYNYKREWIRVIEECYRLKGELYRNYTYAKKVLEFNGNSFKMYKDTVCSSFDLGKKYKLKDIKITLNGIHNLLNLNKAAKASDLKEVFNVKEIVIERDKGFLIESIK